MPRPGKRDFDSMCGRFRVAKRAYASPGTSTSIPTHMLAVQKLTADALVPSPDAQRTQTASDRRVPVLAKSKTAAKVIAWNKSSHLRLKYSASTAPKSRTATAAPLPVVNPGVPSQPSPYDYQGRPQPVGTTPAWSSIGPLKKQSELTSRFRVVTLSQRQQQDQQFFDAHDSTERGSSMPPMHSLITTFPARDGIRDGIRARNNLNRNTVQTQPPNITTYS